MTRIERLARSPQKLRPVDYVDVAGSYPAKVKIATQPAKVFVTI